MSEHLHKAKEIKDEIIRFRRFIHQNAEVGLELPATISFIKNELIKMGYEPQEIGGGIVVIAGKTNKGKTILLRADMDALPMKEENGLDFASKNESAAHTCGHDIHSAMLMGAAKLLKMSESKLNGTVKLMFQPAEELSLGAKNMINAGVMENPKVDAALGIHIATTQQDPGTFVSLPGPFMASINVFHIVVNAKGGHGAMPYLAVDPINVAAHIYLSLQEIISREIDPIDPCVITVAKFTAGTTINIIPEKAQIEGTIRTFSKKNRDFCIKRIKEIAKLTAQKFRAECDVEIMEGAPPLINDEKLFQQISQYLVQASLPVKQANRQMISEDFAFISSLVPAVFLFLEAGVSDVDKRFSLHNPKVIFNEEVLHCGAAAYAVCAHNWLDSNG